jgi:hypothetical protein
MDYYIIVAAFTKPLATSMTLLDADLLSALDVGERQLKECRIPTLSLSLYGRSRLGSSQFVSSLTSPQFIQKVFCNFVAETSSGILSSFPF